MSLQLPCHPMPRGSKTPTRRACTPRLHTRPCLQARAPFAAASSHPGPRLTSPAARPIACCPLCCSLGLPAAFFSLRLVLCQPPGSAAPRSPRPGPTAAASFSSSASSSSAPGCSAQSPRQRRPAPLPPRRQLARQAGPGAQPGPRPPQSPPQGYLPPPWGAPLAALGGGRGCRCPREDGDAWAVWGGECAR